MRCWWPGACARRLLDYGRDKLAGLVLEEAAATSHVAIVARSMGLPMVASLAGIVDNARPGDSIAVEGEMGEVHLRPAGEIMKAFEDKRALRVQAQARFAAVRDLPAVTRDGVAIKLMMNAGFGIRHAATGAIGRGRHRAVPHRTAIHDRRDHAAPGRPGGLHKKILDAAGDKAVVFRTLDLGGDKVLPYARWEREENPALGWRAIRIALDRPALLRYQVRAMLTASAGRTLRVLLPMISDVDDSTAPAPWSTATGTRPAAASGAAHTGAGRRHAGSSGAGLHAAPADALGRFRLHRFQRSSVSGLCGGPHQSPGRQALRQSQSRLAHPDPADREQRGGKFRRPVLCGEMAGRPLDAMALLGLGIRTLSMQQGQIGPIKMIIRCMHLGEVAAFVDRLCGRTDHSLAPRLLAFAAERGIVLK